MDIAALKRQWRTHQKAVPAAAPDVKIGVACSFTIDPLTPYLGAHLLGYGYSNPRIGLADYNQITQSCLAPLSSFGGVDPEVIMILWRIEDLATSEDIASLRDASSLMLSSVSRLHSTFPGAIVLSLPPRPQLASTGLVRFAGPNPETTLWHELSVQIIQEFGGRERVHLLDLESIRANIGAVAHDPRKQFLYRQPFSEAFYAEIGAAAARIIRARRYEAKKCLVLDCDNTLWGGVIGEDGLGGIQLGEDFPGSAFRRFQRQIKAFADSGVFIALNSKNNPDDVWEVFDRHDGMVLSRGDISAAQINWRPKSENLKEIASTLNIGVNSLVFIDDNPFEISEVESHAPEVTCLRAPEELSALPGLLAQHSSLFDRLVITHDDLERVSRMQGESRRQSLSQELTAEDFLAQLGLQVFIYEPEPLDLARVTQLINKTNQFNTQTRRFTREEIDAFLAQPGNRLYCMSVCDKFGEYGLVGVAMLALADGGESAEFVNFLMSCRVLGRGVETTLLAHVAEQAATSGARFLKGSYLPTPKNAMVADLFARHGFEKAGETGGGVNWRLSLPSDLAPPPFVQRVAARPSPK